MPDPLASLPAMDDEQWRSIPGNDEYAVSSHGRVARTTGGPSTRPDPLIHGHLLKAGHRVVQLRDPAYSTGVRTIAVHKLVWLTFHGPIPAGKYVSRLDFDPANDRLDNLCLTTRTEEMERRKAAGRERRLKLSAADREAIAASTGAAWWVAEKYGVHKATVDKIRQGRYRPEIAR